MKLVVNFKAGPSPIPYPVLKTSRLALFYNCHLNFGHVIFKVS